MDSTQFTVVKTFDNEPEAEMAEAYLQLNHIDTLLIREDPARMGIERRSVLKVQEEDLAMARELLRVE